MLLLFSEKAQTKSQLETLPTTTNSFTDFVVVLVIYSDSGGTVNILGGNTIGHCEKKVRMNMG